MTAILPLEAGAVIGGHYRVAGLINTGGFGSVYRGIALSEGNRPCAIKETYDVTPAARRQALMEAAILFTVKSDHLPQVYDAFEENGRFYLVMQLIEGQNCSQMVKTHGGPFSEQEVLGWLLPIADVLQELHGRNPPVLHRDIKPANIILTPQGQAVLVDFGLTRLYDPSTQTQTMARAVSEGFSPLEQYIGQTSPQSDIYALAATMYFLLTAQVPPASVARSMQDTLVPPRQLNPRLTPKVEHALLKAMAVNAEQRFPSMQEFVHALRAPGFTGYAEPTISQTRYEEANARTERASVPPPPPPPPAPVSAWPRHGHAQVYQPVSSNPYAGQRQSGRRTAEPVPGWHSVQPLPPAGRAGHVIPPPAGGSMSVTYPPAQIQRPLPSPFGQGCLWGLVQGVLSALLLFWKGDGVILYAIIMGFLFYMLAGFFTTHRGGRIVRALRAGVWAGITSTLIFWIVVPIGLVIAIAQQAQKLVDQARSQGQFLSFNRAFSAVWNQVLPPRTASTDVRSIVTFLIVGLLCAMGFALLGGLLGYKRSQR
jgi:serine/threonine protein kinase